MSKAVPTGPMHTHYEPEQEEWLAMWRTWRMVDPSLPEMPDLYHQRVMGALFCRIMSIAVDDYGARVLEDDGKDQQVH